MLGKLPRVNPLELRKELLIAESEINRVQLVEEWQAMATGIHSFAGRAKSVSALASAAAVLVTGVAAFRRGKSGSIGANPSWLQTVLKGAQMAGSLWLAFRARQR